MSYGLYIHLPFCRKKCPYCSFISYSHRESCMEAYSHGAARELELRRRGIFAGNPRTVYIGGGTPSIVPARHIARILRDTVISPEMECTVEANPESLTASWLTEMHEEGVNRLSIGVQALDDRLLHGLGRPHSSAQAREAVRAARAAGIGNLSIDLMFGIPGQTLDLWKQTLEEAMALEVEHISAYSLGVEEDTPFFELSRLGGLTDPDSGVTADMYILLAETAERFGFRRYEISNFAKPGFECRHNRGYWDFSPYLGIGVSAHSFQGTVRSWNTRDIDGYIEACQSGRLPTDGEEILDTSTRAMETLMLSLRTVEGLDLGAFCARFPVNRENMQGKIGEYVGERLMEQDTGGFIRLTVRGMIIADEIVSELAIDVEEKS